MKLAIIGDFNPKSETHIASNEAILHSKDLLQCDLDSYWINTKDITKETFYQFDGFLIAPGSPYSNMDNVINTIQFARENNIPCLGTCGGFQHMVIEYARNILNFKNAQHEEYNKNSSELFITKLSCTLKGREMELNLTPNSKVASLYGKNKVIEKYYCNFGVNPDYLQIIKNGPIHIVGSDREGEIRILEYPDHVFFIGTLYVPQVQSTKRTPHPLVTGFIEAIINRSIIKK
ncbi:MAG: CTP synthase [Promethearchaeota archaeon]